MSKFLKRSKDKKSNHDIALLNLNRIKCYLCELQKVNVK